MMIVLSQVKKDFNGQSLRDNNNHSEVTKNSSTLM